jgi:hypothetical protein
MGLGFFSCGNAPNVEVARVVSLGMSRWSPLVLVVVGAGCAPEDAADLAAAQSAEVQAKEVVGCFLSGDYRTMAKLTLPIIVEGMGGVDAMARTVSDGMKRGPKIVNATVGGATIHRRRPTTYAIVPFKLEVEDTNGRTARDSYLLGVSNDGGSAWRFVDGAGLTPAKLKRVLPDFPEGVTLPRIR